MIDPKIVVKAVQDQAYNLQVNAKMLDFLEGNLETYLIKCLTRILSPRVLAYALERLVPINIVPRYVDKLSNIYQTGVVREVVNGDQSDSDLLSWYEQKMDVNCVMHQANRLFTACKSTLIQPYLSDDGAEIRVIPNDRFVVYSDDKMEPTCPTMIILIMGKDADNRDIYWAYTKDEFLIVRSDESIDYNAMLAMGIPDGVHQYGDIPFVYINSSHLRLIPYPDVDTLRMAEYVPCALTDLNLAAMFASFSITYIKNGELSDPTYAPNALWFLKADDPEKDVEIGTLKPEVSYNEVLNLIQSEMSLWLGSKGIKTGSVGALDAGQSASGIAKVIDEADSFEVRQAQAMTFTRAEHELWELILENMHPIWSSQGMVENKALLSPTASVATKFAVTPVGTQRAQIIADQLAEYNAGFTTKARAISGLNPQLTAAQVDELILKITDEKSSSVTNNVLNGAQVTSAVEIITSAAIGSIPRESAIQLLGQAFGWDEEKAKAILSTIGEGFVQKAVLGNVTTNPSLAAKPQLGQ